MKKLFLSTLLLLFVVNIFAQKNTAAQEATDELVKIYDLNTKQAKQMLVIQERKLRNLEQIKHMKTTDAKMYRHKFRAINQSTDASIRRMLTEAQMKIYTERRMEWRNKRAERIATLKESGLSLVEIEDKLLEEGF